MTVRQLLASLDSMELAEWRAFFILEHEEMKELAQREELKREALRNLNRKNA